MAPTPALTAAATALRCCLSRVPAPSSASVETMRSVPTPSNAVRQGGRVVEIDRADGDAARREVGEFCRIARAGDDARRRDLLAVEQMGDDEAAEMPGRAGDEDCVGQGDGFLLVEG